MSAPMIITFRECLEMLLIIIPLLIYIQKINRIDLSKYIYTGSIFGVLTSIVVGKVLVGQVNTLQGYTQQVFLGAMMILLAILILYNIVWIGKQNKNLTLDINEKYNVKLKGISLFLLAFFTIFRESLEIIIFIVPLANQNPFGIVSGIVLGSVGSVVLSYIVFKTTIKLNIKVIFDALTVILIIIGGEFFGEGLALIVPQLENLELAARLIFTIPLLFIFIKRETRNYLRK